MLQHQRDKGGRREGIVRDRTDDQGYLELGGLDELPPGEVQRAEKSAPDIFDGCGEDSRLLHVGRHRNKRLGHGEIMTQASVQRLFKIHRRDIVCLAYLASQSLSLSLPPRPQYWPLRSPFLMSTPTPTLTPTFSAFQKKVRQSIDFFFTSSPSGTASISSSYTSTSASSAPHTSFSTSSYCISTPVAPSDAQDLDRWTTASPVTSLDSSFSTTASFNDTATTPLRHTSSTSSYTSAMVCTPASSSGCYSSSVATDLFFETPKEQIRASLLLSGQGDYDWSKTPMTSGASMSLFQDVFRNHSVAAPVVQPSTCFPPAPISQTKVRFISLFQQSKVEQTTEEEISFALSQDMELESSQESLFDVPPPIQRCVSASNPRPPSSRRGGRRRSISVDTDGPAWNIDVNCPQFSEYRSPRNSAGVIYRRKRTVADSKDEEDHDDRPLFSPPISENSSRCPSTVTLDSQFALEVTSTSTVAPQSLGSMFSSPNLSMESLALSPSDSLLPPPPTKRSKSVPPLSPHCEDTFDGPPVSSILFSPPRNRRGRSESFTDDFATTLPTYLPNTAESLSYVEGNVLFTPISSRASQITPE